MMTFKQKFVAIGTLVFLNVLAFLFFGILALIPFTFSILALIHIFRL